MITALVIVGVVVILGTATIFLARWSVSHDEYYSRADEALDRREAIRRSGGAKILKFKR